MTPQAKGFEYRKSCEELAIELQKFFLEQTGCEPLVSFNRKDRYVKYMDPSGHVEPLYVDGTTWQDIWHNLRSVRKSIQFAVELREMEENYDRA